MRNIQALIMLILLVSPQPIFAMVRLLKRTKASWSSLPVDVRLYTLQFIASSNVYEVAETVKALNTTNKFCHAAMQSQEIILSILRHMPYLANQYDLITRLYRLPIIKGFHGYRDVVKKSLRLGFDLSLAIQLDESRYITTLLNLENIDLEWWMQEYGSPLMIAVSQANVSNTRLLLEAGANPDVCDKWPLRRAVECENLELVKLLLAYRADPNVSVFSEATNQRITKIRKLLHKAKEKRRARLQLLCGKKPDGCAIT